MEFPLSISVKLGLLVLMLETSFAEIYKAAVVAYKPDRDPADLPDEIRIRNKDKYLKYIEDVKDKADIIIFPEYGLTTNEPKAKSKAHLDSYSIIVPDPKSNFLCNSDLNNVLVGISCGAKSNRIYVVCNVLEKDGANEEMNFYSTNVVFDSDGKLIAKCRKKYPYSNSNYEKGDLNQKCTFDAKFNNKNIVKFALLFDSDMLFYTPESTIHDLILTSSFRNTLTLSYGISLVLGYAVRNKVNLVVSEYADGDNLYGGSGIYLRNGTSRFIMNNANPILISEIRTDENNIVPTNVAVEPPRVPIPTFDLYKSIPKLDQKETEYHHDFTNENYCQFKMDISGNDIQPYKWVALSDKRKYLGQVLHLIVCAVTKPEDSKRIINNKVTISIGLKANNVIQLIPVSLNTNSIPTDFKFEEEDKGTIKTAKITSSKGADLLTFGVVAVLRNDVPSSSSLHVIHICTVGFLPTILFLLSKYLM